MSGRQVTGAAVRRTSLVLVGALAAVLALSGCTKHGSNCSGTDGAAMQLLAKGGGGHGGGGGGHSGGGGEHAGGGGAHEGTGGGGHEGTGGGGGGGTRPRGTGGRVHHTGGDGSSDNCGPAPDPSVAVEFSQ